MIYVLDTTECIYYYRGNNYSRAAWEYGARCVKDCTCTTIDIVCVFAMNYKHT